MRKWTKRIGLSLASLVLCSALATTVLTASTHLPGNQTTPAGFRQYSSVYVKMRDGVEIAVAIMLPPDLRPNERVPVLMRTTRYRRADENWLGAAADDGQAAGIFQSQQVSGDRGGRTRQRRLRRQPGRRVFSG